MLGGPQLSDPVLWNKPCQTSLYFPGPTKRFQAVCAEDLSVPVPWDFPQPFETSCVTPNRAFPKVLGFDSNHFEKIEHFRCLFVYFWNIFSVWHKSHHAFESLKHLKHATETIIFSWIEAAGSWKKHIPMGFCWIQQLLAVRGVRVVVILRNHEQIESDWMPEMQIWARFFQGTYHKTVLILQFAAALVSFFHPSHKLWWGTTAQPIADLPRFSRFQCSKRLELLGWLVQLGRLIQLGRLAHVGREAWDVISWSLMMQVGSNHKQVFVPNSGFEFKLRSNCPICSFKF